MQRPACQPFRPFKHETRRLKRLFQTAERQPAAFAGKRFAFDTVKQPPHRMRIETAQHQTPFRRQYAVCLIGYRPARLTVVQSMRQQQQIHAFRRKRQCLRRHHAIPPGTHSRPFRQIPLRQTQLQGRLKIHIPQRITEKLTLAGGGEQTDPTALKPNISVHIASRLSVAQTDKRSFYSQTLLDAHQDNSIYGSLIY